ncbi:SRPBCC family protein [Micropruina sp. KQZ13P-5]|uniref:SRPBCC family protein n=1 Tax=Micropruina sonneratiae TaxID=2986940 RepID=UPI002225F04F|nr:SRPBCC family protein [Micropruina sp. KQZ13P-5]MCW3159580.1 SRPBCC family protein [Micropruina sp. KQZ13P-5]
MNIINEERMVHASPGAVWAVMSDIARWPHLLSTVDKVTPLDAAAGGVGARFAVKQPGIPELIYEVTQWVPDENFTWVAMSRGVRTVGRHLISAAEGGAHLRVSLEWQGPLSKVITVLFGTRTANFLRVEADTFAASAMRE